MLRVQHFTVIPLDFSGNTGYNSAMLKGNTGKRKT
nr:MAG TPA: hypothetical protein [Caudoviricetes sp.]